MAKKQVKTGLKLGGGPPPGFASNVEIFDVAFEEAMGILDESQYAHVADQVRALASEPDPTRAQTVRVEAVEDFYELKEKGGPLGKINLRVFFGVVNRKGRTIVILGVIKKENEDQTPPAVKRLMTRRLAKYQTSQLSLGG